MYLNVTGDNFKAEKLSVLFKGQEWTVTHYTTEEGSGDDRKTKHHYVNRTRDLVTIPVVLDEFNPKEGMHIQKKKYSFQIKLPDILPPTIPVISGDGGSACVLYNISVSVVTPGTFWNGQVSANQVVNIAGAPKNPGLQATGAVRLEPKTFPIYTCCCIPKGDMSFGGIADKTVVDTSDNVDVRFAIGNNSTVELNAIHMQLVAHANWGDGNGHYNSASYPCSEHMASVNEVEGTDSITKQERRAGKNTTSVQDIFRDLESGKGYSATITHKNERPSYSGALFTLHHQLEFRAQTPCCSTNPTLVAPMRIVATDPKSSVFPEVAVAERLEDKNGYEEVAEKDFTQVSAYYGGVAAGEDDSIEAPKVIGGGALTLNALVEEMEHSIYDGPVVQKYVAAADGEASWMKNLTANDLNNILSKVHDVFCRKEIADMLFGVIDRPLVVEDIICCLPHLYTSSQKAEFVQAQIEKCTDADSSGKGRVKEHLSSLEAMLVGSILD